MCFELLVDAYCMDAIRVYFGALYVRSVECTCIKLLVDAYCMGAIRVVYVSSVEQHVHARLSHLCNTRMYIGGSFNFVGVKVQQKLDFAMPKPICEYVLGYRMPICKN